MFREKIAKIYNSDAIFSLNISHSFQYDRGFYWDFNQLPFPFSSNLNELILNISQYNSHSYLMNLDSWIKNTWHLEDDGHSCERLLKWIGNNK